ncbi:hypothetical protein Dimus_035122 [Dionaea muscipula]
MTQEISVCTYSLLISHVRLIFPPLFAFSSLVCPLAFPDTRNVTKECGVEIRNRSACCSAVQSYVTRLQNQSFTTNIKSFELCCITRGEIATPECDHEYL